MKLMRTLVITLGLLMGLPSASACGGFFCNGQNPVPIFQAGERIIFAKHDGLTTMHIEVSFEGQPTDFGWIMPLVDRPMDQKGNILPLDKALSLSHEAFFDMLASRTAPNFGANYDTDGDSCQNDIMAMSAAGSSGGGDAELNSGPVPGQPPAVVVVEEANIGPYAAQLIQATNADALYDWLKEHGYQQDEKARSTLKHYVSQDFVFLGLRLKNAEAAGDLRPVAITLGEDAPCVPLRLTSIAATDGMPITVFVYGEHRAVPKNMLHATINPRALTYPGAAEYQDVLAAAVDQASGHAWVTQFSGTSTNIRYTLLASHDGRKQDFVQAKTVVAALQAYSGMGLPVDATFQQIARDAVPFDGAPEGMEWLTEDNYYADLLSWVSQLGEPAEADVELLKQRLLEEVIEPFERMQELADKGPTLTRLYTEQDPAEMNRDPIFVFNADLPEVSNLAPVDVMVHDLCSNIGWTEITYSDGSVHVDFCEGNCNQFPTVNADLNAAPALRVDLLTETGNGIEIHPNDISRVDLQLGLAVAGKPSLPEGFELTAIGPKKKIVTGDIFEIEPHDAARLLSDPNSGSTGCTATDGHSSPMAGGLAAFALLLLAIRRRLC